MLNKLPVSQLAELSSLSKAYISQVKHGIRPPSQKLIDAIASLISPEKDYLALFLKSRESMGVSPKTLRFYKDRLGQFIRHVDYPRASRSSIERYLSSIPANKHGLATRHASYRTIKTFYRWLQQEFRIRNPIVGMKAPILGKPILTSLEKHQVHHLIEQTAAVRDKAIISLFAESGLRLSELVNIKLSDIDWQHRTISVVGKGRKGALAPFAGLSEALLREWLEEYRPNGNIWGLNEWGIASMLRRLELKTGIPCNPHTFRRTFACLLRKAGVDTMTIKDLGRWESLEMVQRYTRSITFQDSLKFYKAPLG
jgi:site-specific recombinase XerD